MISRRFLAFWTALTACLSCSRAPASATPPRRPVVRLAELEIDRAQLGPYLAALREEVETSIRVEPGVLTLYSVQVKGAPSRVRLFEMYADSNAYNAHIVSPISRSTRLAPPRWYGRSFSSRRSRCCWARSRPNDSVPTSPSTDRSADFGSIATASRD
jgi:quinol monooxygenase YgiN